MSRFQLWAAANVLIPSYLALLEKGYEVRCKKRANGEEFWVAEKDLCEITADDTTLLLGLVALYETRGEDWRASDEQIDSFINHFWPEEKAP